MGWKSKKRRSNNGSTDGDSKRRKSGEGEYPPPHVLENDSFEAYYRGQGLVPDGEWEAFMTTLRKPLGVSFRITGHPGAASYPAEARLACAH